MALTTESPLLKFVYDLRPGDLVDLQGDPYADPKHDKPALVYEYQTVIYVEKETPDCVAVGFEGFDAIGFPPNHMVKVQLCPTVQMAVPREPSSIARVCPTVQMAVPREPSSIARDLAASLHCYCSDDDWGKNRRTFLQSVSDRINMDLATGEY